MVFSIKSRRVSLSPTIRTPFQSWILPARRSAADESLVRPSIDRALRARHALHLPRDAPGRAADYRVQFAPAVLRAVRRDRSISAGAGGGRHPDHLAHRPPRSLGSM